MDDTKDPDAPENREAATAPRDSDAVESALTDQWLDAWKRDADDEPDTYLHGDGVFRHQPAEWFPIRERKLALRLDLVASDFGELVETATFSGAVGRLRRLRPIWEILEGLTRAIFVEDDEWLDSTAKEAQKLLERQPELVPRTRIARPEAAAMLRGSVLGLLRGAGDPWEPARLRELARRISPLVIKMILRVPPASWAFAGELRQDVDEDAAARDLEARVYTRLLSDPAGTPEEHRSSRYDSKELAQDIVRAALRALGYPEKRVHSLFDVSRKSTDPSKT
jgi:hypothetical protein